MSSSSRQLNVLITACASRTATHMVIESLKDCREFTFRFHGADIVERDRVASPLEYARVLPCSEPGYVDSVCDVVRERNIDIVFPLLEEELILLKGPASPIAQKVAGMSARRARMISDTGTLLALISRKLPSGVCGFHLLSRNSEIVAACRRLGYPGRALVFKPRRSRGARGVFVISDGPVDFSARELFPRYTPQELMRRLPDGLPSALLMEYLDGEDYTVFCFARRGKLLWAVPVRRLHFTPGITWCGEIRADQRIHDYVSDLGRVLRLDGYFNVQLRLMEGRPFVYEINPRYSGSTGVARAVDINAALDIVKHHLGLQVQCQSPSPGAVRFTRELREVYFYPPGTGPSDAATQAPTRRASP